MKIFNKIFPLLLVLLFNINVFAVNFGAGLISYYGKWLPAFRDNMDSCDTELYGMIGPALSVSFLDKWTLSGLFLMPITGAGFPIKYSYSGTGDSGDYTVSADTIVERADMDITLTYNLGNGFKIFGGYKWFHQGYSGSDSSPAEFTYNGTTSDLDDLCESSKLNANGVGLGGSYAYRITENMSLITNISLIYLKTKVQYPELAFDPDTLTYPGTVTYNVYGTNATISLSYYIEAMSTAVTVGLRYQYLKYFADGDNSYNLSDDQYYAITMSAMYFF